MLPWCKGLKTSAARRNAGKPWIIRGESWIDRTRRAHQPALRLKASENPSRGHTSFDRSFLSVPSTARPFAGLSVCRRSSSCNTCSRWRAWSASACSHSWVIFCRGHVWSSQWRSRLRERAMILVHAREQWRGGQNRSAKNSNARHQADDKALRIHPPPTRGGLRAVKGKPGHHPFVGDYAIRLRVRCRRSLLPRRLTAVGSPVHSHSVAKIFPRCRPRLPALCA
jgi:hypothetical protein